MTTILRQPITRAKDKAAKAIGSLVAEVEFRGWSTDGLVRHASFQGLRKDKRPEEVIRERET